MSTQGDYEMFSAVWKFCRTHPDPSGTAAEWETIIQEAREIHERYPTEFCKRLVLCVLDELERRSKENALT